MPRLHEADRTMSDRYVETITSPADIDHLISKYKFEEPIQCSIANCRQRHKNGYYVRLKSGEVGKIGRICGRNFLGATTYKQMERDLIARQNREALLATIRSPNFDIERAIAAVESWRPKLQSMRRVRADLQYRSPSATKALITAVCGKMNADDPTAKWFEAMEGRRWLKGDANADFTKAMGHLSRARALLAKANMTDDDRGAAIRAANAARLALQSAADGLDGFMAFCRPQNLPRIVTWFHGWVLNYGGTGYEGIEAGDLPPDTEPVNRSCLDYLDTGQ